MAVNIIISPTFEDAKSEILKKITANNKSGTSHLVIVPDRHSLSYQRAVIEELNLTSVSNIEVVSFSRLADLNITKDKRYLTPQSAVMLMRKVINKNKNNLLRYKRSSNNVGFADEMFAVVSDIRNSNISEDTILSKIDSIKNVAMRNKISDIALLYKGYIEELESHYFDATSKFGALIDMIDTIDMVKNSYVYVCDYYEFTNVELKLLEKIMTATSDIYISLVEKSKGSNARIFPRVSSKIINIARANDLKVNKEVHEMADSPNALIYNNLFGYINDYKVASAKPISLKSAKNIEEEMSFIASNIAKSVREQGLRYRDISIAVSDIEGYKSVIDAVMRRYHIPYYIDDKVKAISAPSIRHILMALTVVQNKYKRCDMISYLMNGLTMDITNDEKDIFTNYVVKYNIDRSVFLKEFTICDKEKGEDLALLNDIRRRMLKGFDVLEENNITQKMSLHIDSIYKYMKEISFVDRINTYAKAEFDNDFKIESEVTTQAPKKLFKFFEELMMVANDEEMSQREFLDILLASLERVDISLIPKFNDCVYIGDMTKSRYDKVREMYFVGMVQDSVPADVDVRGIMGQDEVDVFSTLGMNIEPSPKEKNLLGRFSILELLMKGQDKVYLSYPLEGVDGKSKTPSIVMKQLSDIYSQDITSINRYEDVISYMCTYDNAKYLTAQNYGKYSYSDYKGNSDEQKIAKYLRDEDKFRPFDYNDDEIVDDIHDLYFKKYSKQDVLSMSASRIESYLRCPYKSYLEYVLDLKEREVSDIKVAEVGTILHEVLQLLIGKEIDLPKDEKGKLTDEEIEEFVSNYVANNCDFEPKIKHELYDRCLHVALKTYNMLKVTSYYPIEVEYKFSDFTKHLGAKYRVTGSIDRIDDNGGKCYIVDYKSSSDVGFELKNIYFGDRVQLFMYAAMYKMHTNSDLVGLFYMPMPGSFADVQDAKDKFKFKGIILSDDILNMNQEIYPYKIKELKSGSKIVADGGQIVSSEELSMLSNYVDKLIDNVIRDIKNGYIAKNPLEGKCKYCDYKNICGMYGNEVRERKIKKVTMNAFKEDDNE